MEEFTISCFSRVILWIFLNGVFPKDDMIGAEKSENVIAEQQVFGY